jgi:hypothetical protein
MMLMLLLLFFALYSFLKVTIRGWWLERAADATPDSSERDVDNAGQQQQKQTRKEKPAQTHIRKTRPQERFFFFKLGDLKEHTR